MVVYGISWAHDRLVHDNYWKLDAHWTRSIKDLTAQLHEQNYKVLKLANKNRLVLMLSRHDRGLLSYDGCRVEELRMFCTQRGLSSSTTQRPNKAQLVEMLEQADDKATFPHFIDLPAELRVHVYTLYFGSLPELAQPTQPPISKSIAYYTNRILADILQNMQLCLEDAACQSQRGVPIFPPLKMSKGDFFSGIPEEHLKLIRQLSIDTFRQNSFSFAKTVK